MKSFMFLVTMVLMTTYILVVPVKAAEDEFPFKTNVVVTNNLGTGINLLIRCRSKDDDLGVHNLPNGQPLKWSFKANFFGTTLFWCNLSWNNVQKNVEIYNDKPHDPECVSQCLRSVRQDGLYFYNEKKGAFWYKKYSW